MPCRSSEEEREQTESPHSSVRLKKSRKERAIRVVPDDDEQELESEGNEEVDNDKRRRKWNGRGDYRLVKRWVTGECAEMEDADIHKEIFDLARSFMEESKLKTIPTHVPNETDIGLWKLYREYTKVKTGIKIQLYRCPLHYRCGCAA